VTIDYQVDEPERTTGVGFENGVIGVDTNPDCIAVANVSNDGNLIETKMLAISGIGAKNSEAKSSCKNCSQGARFSP
jgi:hypothetical protein